MFYNRFSIELVVVADCRFYYQGKFDFSKRKIKLLMKEIDRRKLNKAKYNVEVSENIFLFWTRSEPDRVCWLNDFVHIREENNKKERKIRNLLKNYKNHYRMYRFIAGDIWMIAKELKKSLNQDLKFCYWLINEINSWAICNIIDGLVLKWVTNNIYSIRYWWERVDART